MPPATASAADLCLGVGAHCPDGASQYASLKAAADAISFGTAGAGPYRVFVGPGEWPGGATFMRQVAIVGAGRDATTITPPASGTSIILGNSGSSIRDLTIEHSGARLAVKMDAGVSTLERVTIAAATAVSGMEGVRADFGATLDDVKIDLGGASPAGVALVSLRGGQVLVEDSRLRAGIGFDSPGSTSTAMTVRRSHLEAVRGVQLPAGTLNMASSSIRVLPGAGGVGVRVGGYPGPATAKLHGLTIVGAGSDEGIGIHQHAVTSSSVVDVDASGIVFAWGLYKAMRVERQAGSSGQTTGQLADFAVPESFLGSDRREHWFELVNADGVSTARRYWIDDAALRDVAGGDLRPRIDSGLVDPDPDLAVLPAWAGTTDLLGGARLVDGDRDGSGARDIGAVEYVPQAPVVRVTASKRTARTGEEVVFTAAVTDDPGDTSSIRWRFSDGSTATGTTVRKRFATPGAHRATATAVDSTGLSGSAAAATTVSAPPSGPGATPGGPSGAPPTGSSGTGGSSSNPPAKLAKITFGRLGTLRLRRGRVAIPVRCDAACTGTLTLRTSGRKPKVLGRATFKLTRAGAKNVSVKIAKSGLRRLRRGRTTKVVLAVRSGKAAELSRSARVRR